MVLHAGVAAVADSSMLISTDSGSTWRLYGYAHPLTGFGLLEDMTWVRTTWARVFYACSICDAISIVDPLCSIFAALFDD